MATPSVACYDMTSVSARPVSALENRSNGADDMPQPAYATLTHILMPQHQVVLYLLFSNYF